MERVNLRPRWHGRLTLAMVAAATVAGGCLGPNPAFTGVDALGRPGAGGSGGTAGAGGSGGSGSGRGGAGGSAGGSGGAGGTLPSGDASSDDAAPSPTMEVSPPADAVGMDVAAPVDLPTLPPDTAPPPADMALPVDMAPPIDLPAADAPTDAPRAPTSRYNFEASAQNWVDLRPGREFPTTLTRVTAPAPAWDGQWAMAITMRSGTDTTHDSVHRIIGIAQAFGSQLPANRSISYRIYLPAGDALNYVQPFVLYYKPADADGDPQWGGIDPPLFAASLARGQWVPIPHRVPSNADSRGVVEVGLEFVLRPSRTLTVYLDGVDW